MLFRSAWKAVVLPLNYSRNIGPSPYSLPRRENEAGSRRYIPAGTVFAARACRPRRAHTMPIEFCLSQNSIGRKRIRTSEAQVQQIYSLPPLATWVSARELNSKFCILHFKFLIYSELAKGIEPSARGLQNRRATVAPRQRRSLIKNSQPYNPITQ